MRGHSSFFGSLKRTRIVIDPYEMLCAQGYLRLTDEALGILIRLLVYVGREPCQVDLRSFGRLAGVSTRKMQRIWPLCEPLFDRHDDGTVQLKDLEWVRFQTIVADRQSLRRLLDHLVAYWGAACVYCGSETADLQIEHIVPVVRGGTDDLTNLTLACGTCNLKKRTQTAAEFGHPHIHDLASRIQ